MKKDNKLRIMSLLTSAFILTSSIPINYNSNRYISAYYDILSTDIEKDCQLDKEEINFIPKDDYIPQGITIVEDYIVTSHFDYYKNNNSKLCIYTKDGTLINTCTLDNKAHVGGIAYDQTNSLLWTTTSLGNVCAYTIKDVLENKTIFPIVKDINVGTNLPNYKYPWLKSASFITIHNNELLVGNFSLTNTGRIKRYTINKEKDNITLNYIGFFSIPNKVQGITFYKKEDNEYIIFSRSYGRKSPSIIQIFKYSTEITDYQNQDIPSKSIRLTPMLEQITCINNKLYGIFESNAKPYTNQQETDFDSIPVIDIEETIKKLEFKKDTN